MTYSNVISQSIGKMQVNIMNCWIKDKFKMYRIHKGLKERNILIDGSKGELAKRGTTKGCSILKLNKTTLYLQILKGE